MRGPIAPNTLIAATAAACDMRPCMPPAKTAGGMLDVLLCASRPRASTINPTPQNHFCSTVAPPPALSHLPKTYQVNVIKVPMLSGRSLSFLYSMP